MTELQTEFGEIDIYLFDQLLKGRLQPEMKILDAGCGSGRNLVYLLRKNYDVYGVDESRDAIKDVRRLSRALNPHQPSEKFRQGNLESLPYPAECFDFIICNAVLHFASDDDHFLAMLNGLWRVLKPDGTLFCRLASSIGWRRGIKRLVGRRHLLPDGSERYLVDAALLQRLAKHMDAELVDPLKTTIVQNQRSMTTWVIRKRSSG